MNKIRLKQADELINRLNLEPVLNDRVRQVRWLYNNSNKCTKVYEEKLVRLMVFKLKQRIVQLESELTKLKLKNGKLPIPHVSDTICDCKDRREIFERFECVNCGKLHIDKR